MRFRERRAIEAEVQAIRRTCSKMEKALEDKQEELRKLEKELQDHADHQSAREAASSSAEA